MSVKMSLSVFSLSEKAGKKTMWSLSEGLIHSVDEPPELIHLECKIEDSKEQGNTDACRTLFLLFNADAGLSEQSRFGGN